MGPDPGDLSAPSVPEQLSGPGMAQNNALLQRQTQAQQMIRELLLKRMLASQGGGMPMAPPAPMLGTPPARPMAPPMVPGQPPFNPGGASGGY